MNIILRGIKNAFRNVTRTVSITLILAISISLALVMVMALKTVQAKIDSVKSSIGNVITVSPAGARGFEGGGEPLTGSDISQISSLKHTAKITETLMARLTPQGSTSTNGTSANTSLSSAIAPGTLGRREGEQGGGFQGGPSGGTERNFVMPITVTGTNDLSSAQSLNASQLTIKSGSSFDATKEENIALVGAELATTNNLSAGSSFQAYNENISVSGIFDAGNTFTNSSVIMPIKSLQRLSGQTDEVSTALVKVDSIENVASVEKAIKDKLGSKADVVSSQEASSQVLSPLENIKTISLYSLIGALIAGSIIIFLAMLMIVRERRKEIGVLKAIGARDIKITLQFVIESLVLTLMSGVIGILISLVLSNPILSVLASSSTSGTRMGGAMRGGFMRGFMSGAQSTFQNFQAVIGYDVLLYGLLVALAIAVVGSFVPSWFISKIRPSEIIKGE